MAPIRVLIVHDDAVFFERAKQGIVGAFPDAQINGAISAPRALGMAKQQMPDAIIADGDLEGMDGYAFTSELKADPTIASIPVLIVADEPSEASALKARQVGAAGHLPASVDIGSLVQKIGSLTQTAPVASAAAAPIQQPVEPLGVQGQPAGGPAPAPAPLPGYGQPAAEGMPAPLPGPLPVSGAGMQVPPQMPQPAMAAAMPGAAQQPPHVAAPSAIGSASAPDIPHVDDLLRHMIDIGGSDLHITVGSPPGIRVRGEVAPVEGGKVLTPKDTQEMLLSLLSEEQRRRFETELELDFAYSIPGLSRFRTNIFQQRNSMGAVFRVIPLKIPTLEELQLPRVCKFLAERPRGMVLVTGPTGSGKSTTLAAMIDHINATRPVHIITLEDPIEFMHKNKKAYVNQREVGEDTHSFTAALKRVLRQDPDVILVGEMRDLETISAALTAAETGHLVLATLHTTGGPETVDRIIDVFPPHQQQQVRMQLSTTLEGVLSQTLLRSTDGRSRVMAMEIMLGIPAISNLIREGKTHQMATIIQGGAAVGMQTLDQHLKTLLQAGRVTYEEAIQKAKEPRELAQMLGRKL